jgi:hypothetical protein
MKLAVFCEASICVAAHTACSTRHEEGRHCRHSDPKRHLVFFGCYRKLDAINMRSIRPDRDAPNLARHFSAGNSESKQMSPVGTIE